MATLLEIKTAAANYLNRPLSDFIQNGQDLWLVAANQVRKTAELNHDFEFNRKLVTVTVNGTTGGDLGSAEDRAGNLVDIKTVIEVGLLDDKSNLIPVEWTTVAESIERQRADEYRPSWPRYASDEYDRGQRLACGPYRFTFSGDEVNCWPKTDTNAATDYALFLEVYGFTSDWTDADINSGNMLVSGTLSPSDAIGTYTYKGNLEEHAIYLNTAPGIGGEYILGHSLDTNPKYWFIQKASDGILSFSTNTWVLLTDSQSPVGSYTPAGTYTGTATVTAGTATAYSNVWTTHGQQYLLWATIVQLNQLFKRFVPRQEGNLPPPQAMVDAGLATLLDWDNNKFEEFRRHNR